MNKVFQLSNKERGITQYLSNPETDLMELVQPSDVNKNLFVLPGGAVPPNPTELLARNGLDKAIEILKQNFDYVIMDTAPIGMVTDTLLVGRVADLSKRKFGYYYGYGKYGKYYGYGKRYGYGYGYGEK